MQYIQDYGGYIADVPKIWFKRCDGRVFYFDQLIKATVRPVVKQKEVNAGWSQHPVAYLPSQSVFKIEATSAKFDLDIFEMANATEFVEENNCAIPVSEELPVDSLHSCMLSYIPIGEICCQLKYTPASSYEEISTDAQLPFEVDSQDAKLIHFDENIIKSGSKVLVTYFRQSSALEAKIAVNTPTVGEAIIAYPVYGNDKIYTETSVIGHVFIRVFKARIVEHSQQTSKYKSSATHRFVLQAMDAKRVDGANYTVAYIAKFHANIDALNTKML